MPDLSAALFAGILGFIIAFAELITSTYPRTCFFLLRKSWKLYFYSFIYGAIAFVFMWFLFDLGLVKFEGIGVSNIWVQSILVGISTKAILHIRFFSVNAGSQSFPVGIETVLQLFEPWLLKEINLEEFNLVKEFVDKAEKKYNNLSEVKEKIINNIPANFTEKDKEVFLLDLNETNSVSKAMELYLREFGKKSFDRVFPL